MFGKKKDVDLPKVPVYTVHTLPRNYETLSLVSVTNEGRPLTDNDKLIDELAVKGFESGADAVIGITFQSFMKITNIYGTAIKYID